MTLVHQFARLFADCNGASSALIGDAGLVERRQKTRIGARIIAARIGLYRRGQADCGGDARKQYRHSHRFILVQDGAAVVPTLSLGPNASLPKSRNLLVQNVVCRRYVATGGDVMREYLKFYIDGRGVDPFGIERAWVRRRTSTRR